MNNGNSAFTLIELITVIVIIGILAGIAIPSYKRSREKAMALEAIANLKLIAAAERIYQAEHDQHFFESCECPFPPGVCNCNGRLHLALNRQNFIYQVFVDNTSSPPNFFILAIRNTGLYTYILRDADEDGEPDCLDPGTDPCPQ